MSQTDYIEVLFDQLSFSEPQKRDWLYHYYGRRRVDELPLEVQTSLIQRLLRQKAVKLTDNRKI